MSEVQSRPSPARGGRGSGRGGRGGFSSRGGGRSGNRVSSTTNGDMKHEAESAMPSIEDEGEVGALKKVYGSKIGGIKEMFPDWSDVDILFALQETEGDTDICVTRMLDGTISQWGEVSKQKKDRTRPKAKNDVFTTTTGDSGPGYTRTGRGGRPGPEGGRGGRGRATERGGRGSSRGKSAHATTNGSRAKENVPLSVPTEEAEWDNAKPSEESTAGWGDTPAEWDAPTTAAQPTPSTATTAPTAPKTSIIPENTQKTWASMLRQSTAPKPVPVPKPKEEPVHKVAEPVIEPLPPVEPVPEQAEPEPAVADEPEPEPVTEHEPAPVEIPVVVPEVALLPSKDQLTETNLEQINDDDVKGPDTDTLKSEAASSYDPRAAAVSATATPLSASQQQHQAARAPASGYAATAIKATERASTRTPSYQRRMLDQEEAVRMPHNRDQVERTTLQFGAFSLDDDDIDGDREEPETRAQPPHDSPVSHPRTSLPPAQQQAVPEAFTAQKPAAVNAPTAPIAAPTTAPTQPAALSQATPQPPTQPSQFGRFSQPVPQEPASFSAQKQFDGYGQPQPSTSAAQNQYEGNYQNPQQSVQPQGLQQPQQPQQQAGGAFSSAPGEFSSYYTSDPQNRNPYNYYNQSYNNQQPGSQGQHQEGLPPQQQAHRSYNGYSAAQNESLSQYPQSSGHHAPSRFASAAAADNSGNTTPNPTGAAQGQQAGQNNNQAQSQGQQPHEYPYAHPYYTNAYYSAYMNYPGGYNQGGYGAPYGKGGAGGAGGGYGQPHQYGMQGPHGYGSSPGTGFGQTALGRSDSGVGAGAGEYGRAGASGGQQGLSSSNYGGMHDAFGRSGSAYQSQAGQSYNASGAQAGNGPPADDLKPYNDNKGGAGPSPSLANAARPGSVTNNTPSGAGLPPQQSTQGVGLGGMGGYGGYGHNMQQQGGHNLHNNQTGNSGYGMSGSGNQGHQNNYGAYGQGNAGGGGFGSYYGQPRSNAGAGGWANNYS